MDTALIPLSITSLVAGGLTILAPCVLPVLPVVLAGSVSEKSRWYPLVVIVSLAVSVFAFTVILKASSILLGISPDVWTVISGGIVMALGLSYVFPHAWGMISSALWASRAQQALISADRASSSLVRALLTGAALGPVFSSCSPTYSLVLATVFPASFALGMWYTALYSLGLALAIVPIALGGRAVVKKLWWLADERSAFKKVLGILLVLVGLSIVTGFEKTIETAALERFDVQFIERGILDSVTGAERDMPTPAAPSGEYNMDIIPYNVSIPYPAPELSLSDWINSEPLTMESLRGKVVLIDFWTYSCINCQRTLSYLSDWYAKYHDDGLVIIGVHAPEFAFERVPENVAKAVKEAGIKYPVGLDNDYSLWNVYRNRYWPAKYFIDREGRVRHTHFGEGAYDESERVIRGLLGLTGEASATTEQSAKPVSREQSPETYLGSSRRANFVESSMDLEANEWTLSSSWQTEGQYVESTGDAGLSYKFNAKDVYLVLSGSGTVGIRMDGAIPPDTEDVSGGMLRVDGSRLYHVFGGDSFVRGGVLRMDFPVWIRAFAFTFGS